MKNWLIGLVVTMAWTSPCVAQVAPELLGARIQTSRCLANPSTKGLRAIGCWYANPSTPVTTARLISSRQIPPCRFAVPPTLGWRERVMAVFGSSARQSPVTKPEIAPITLSSTNHPTQNVQAAHVSMPGQSSGALLLTIDVQKSLEEKPDSNELAIQLQGKRCSGQKLSSCSWRIASFRLA